MAWFRITAEIEMEIQAADEEDARLHADTILEKRVVGQTFGDDDGYQGEFTSGEVTGVDVVEGNEEDEVL